MVNVIVNLLCSALFAVITSITLFGPEGKAIVREIDDGEWRAMSGGAETTGTNDSMALKAI